MFANLIMPNSELRAGCIKTRRTKAATWYWALTLSLSQDRNWVRDKATTSLISFLSSAPRKRVQLRRRRRFIHVTQKKFLQWQHINRLKPWRFSWRSRCWWPLRPPMKKDVRNFIINRERPFGIIDNEFTQYVTFQNMTLKRFKKSV